MRENEGLESTAVTIGIFMGHRLTEASERTGTSPTSEKRVATAQSVFAGTPSRPQATRYASGLPLGMITASPDQRRLEIERGPGGDTDIPFTFIPPANPRQRLAWVRLLTRVHRGELVP